MGQRRPADGLTAHIEAPYRCTRAKNCVARLERADGHPGYISLEDMQLSLKEGKTYTVLIHDFPVEV
jgi:hypothetical protein